MMVHAVSVAQPDLPYDVMHTDYVAYLLHLSVEQPELTRLCCTTSPSAHRPDPPWLNDLHSLQRHHGHVFA